MSSNCNDCIFREKYVDMGASFDICTLVDDLTLASAEIKFFSRCNMCKCYLSGSDLRSFVKNNTDECVYDVFNFIKLNKE